MVLIRYSLYLVLGSADVGSFCEGLGFSYSLT